MAHRGLKLKVTCLGHQEQLIALHDRTFSVGLGLGLGLGRSGRSDLDPRLRTIL